LQPASIGSESLVRKKKFVSDFKTKKSKPYHCHPLPSEVSQQHGKVQKRNFPLRLRNDKSGLPLQPASTGSASSLTNQTRFEKKNFETGFGKQQKSYLPLQPASNGRGKQVRQTKTKASKLFRVSLAKQKRFFTFASRFERKPGKIN
jgi:hypothetical protein